MAYVTRDEVERMVGFIQDHSFSAYEYRDASNHWMIKARMVYCVSDSAERIAMRPGDLEHYNAARSFTRWETVEPSWKAVRDWLGY